MIEIRDRWNGSVKHAVDAPTVRAAVLILIAQAAEKEERADLSDADLSDADLSRADLTIPIVSDLDIRIEEATRPDGALDMARWHTCETTHCRVGWAIQLAGPEGAALEARVGPSAGALIYAASGSHPVPSFSADDFDARADIVARADARRAQKAAPAAEG